MFARSFSTLCRPLGNWGGGPILLIVVAINNFLDASTNQCSVRAERLGRLSVCRAGLSGQTLSLAWDAASAPSEVGTMQ